MLVIPLAGGIFISVLLRPLFLTIMEKPQSKFLEKTLWTFPSVFETSLRTGLCYQVDLTPTIGDGASFQKLFLQCCLLLHGGPSSMKGEVASEF